MIKSTSDFVYVPLFMSFARATPKKNINRIAETHKPNMFQSRREGGGAISLSLFVTLCHSSHCTAKCVTWQNVSHRSRNGSLHVAAPGNKCDTMAAARTHSRSSTGGGLASGLSSMTMSPSGSFVAPAFAAAKPSPEPPFLCWRSCCRGWICRGTV